MVNIRWAIKFSLCLVTSFNLLACGKLEQPVTLHDANSGLRSGDDVKSLSPEERAKAAKINIDLGLGYLDQQQYARAKRKLLHAVALAPKLPAAHMALAQYWQRVEDQAEAEKAYLLSLKYGGKQGQYYHAYANFLCSVRRYPRAQDNYQAALADKLYEATAMVHLDYGLCAQASHDYGLAERQLYLALKHDPLNKTIWWHLAKLGLAAKKYQLASAALAEYRPYVPQNLEPEFLAVEIQLARQYNDFALIDKNMKLLRTKYPDSIVYQQLMVTE